MYDINEGEQDAFGDYTLIKVGKQYYLFCDYDPKEPNKSMRVGRWRSDDITSEFIWDGEIGEGFHPDPCIGFAEGKFYLIVQRNNIDFVSDGPWVDGVELKIGFDTTNDGKIDTWSPFTPIKETYQQKEGYVKVLEAMPAELDLTKYGEVYGYQLQLSLNKSSGFSSRISQIKVEME